MRPRIPFAIFLALALARPGLAGEAPPARKPLALTPEEAKFGVQEIPNPSIDLSIASVMTNGTTIEHVLKYSAGEPILGARVKTLLTCIGKSNAPMTSMEGALFSISKKTGTINGTMDGPIMLLNIVVDGVKATNGSMVVRVACFEEGTDPATCFDDRFGAQLSNPVEFLVNSVAPTPTNRQISVIGAPKGSSIRLGTAETTKDAAGLSGVETQLDAGGQSGAARSQRSRAHDGYVSAIAFSPDGKLLASGSIHDKTTNHAVKLWTLPSGKLLTAIRGHTDCANGVAISPSGMLLASGSADGTVKLWTLPEIKLRKTLPNHGQYNNMNSIAISADGKLMAFIGGGGINLSSLPEGTPLANLTDLGQPWITAISPSGNLLASGHGNINNGLVGLWSLPDGKLLKELAGHKQSVWAIAISPDGSLLASGGQDRTIKIWTLPEGELQKTLSARGIVNSLSISPDGKTLAAGEHGKIEFWSLPDGTYPYAVKDFEPPANIKSLAFSPDGTVLASGGNDGQINLWETRGEMNHRALIDPSVE